MSKCTCIMDQNKLAFNREIISPILGGGWWSWDWSNKYLIYLRAHIEVSTSIHFWWINQWENMGKYSMIFNKSRNMGDAININQLRDVSNRVLHKPFTGDISTAWCWEAKKTIWGGTCGVSTSLVQTYNQQVQVRTNKYEQHMSIIAHNFGAATSKSERLSNDGCAMEIKEIKPLEFNRSMQQIADNCNIKRENCEPSRMGISIYIHIYIYRYTHGKKQYYAGSDIRV